MQHNTLPIPAPFSPHPPSSPTALFSPPSPPPSSLPFLPASQQRMCLGERVCVREKRKAVSRMDMCPLSSTLSSPTSSSSSSPPTHLCFSSPSSNSAAPWAPSVPALGEKETRRLDGWLKTELQCQQGIRRKVATNQKVMGHKQNTHAQTFTAWLLTTVLEGQHPVILYG